MSRTQRMIALAGILLLAAFFRLYQHKTLPPGLYPDEAMNGNNAVEVLETGKLKVFYPENNGREGLYIDSLVVLFKFFPVYRPWVERLPAELSGILTVGGTYLLVAELLGESTGLFAAFLTATGLWVIFLSRIGFRANFCVMLLVFGCWLLLKCLRATSTRRAMLYAIAGGIVYALGYYTYIPIRITPLLLLVCVPFFRKRPVFWPRAAVFTAVTLAVLTPLAIYFIRNPAAYFGRTVQVSITNDPHPALRFGLNILRELAMLDYHGDMTWRHGFFQAPALVPAVGILFWIGVFASLRRLYAAWSNRNQHPFFDEPTAFPLIFLFSWFILTMLPAAAAMSAPSALRSILMIPAVMAFAAIGGALCFKWMQDKTSLRNASIITAIFIALLAIHSYVRYFLVYAKIPVAAVAFNAPDVAAGDALNALPAETPKYIIIEGEPDTLTAGGYPINAQTIMFITHSYTLQDRAARNIHYVLARDIATIPAGTPAQNIVHIYPSGQ
jgi:4-amino-4-deoxy-L-arabinose transferase-like glycosyltransferase